MEPAYSEPEEDIMSAAIVERITEAEARARRDEILRMIGDDVDSFRARARDYVLSTAEQSLFDELEDLEYLLAL